MRRTALFLLLVAVGCDQIPPEMAATEQAGMSAVASAYERNAVAAADQYNGRRFLIVVVVDKVIDGKDGPILLVSDGCRPGRKGGVELRPSERQQAAKLKPGQVVVIDAKIDQVKPGTVSFADGQILESGATLETLRARKLAAPWVLYAAAINGKPVQEAANLLGPPELSREHAAFNVKLSTNPGQTTRVVVGLEGDRVVYP